MEEDRNTIRLPLHTLSLLVAILLGISSLFGGVGSYMVLNYRVEQLETRTSDLALSSKKSVELLARIDERLAAMEKQGRDR